MENRIVRFSKHGGPEVLEIVKESANEPQEDEPATILSNNKSVGLSTLG